ncbi:hypothetical protein N8466_00440 [Gammaproteobacteria bacterium]|nr:hypothetical protein [Gammaproteobacteria bacterium]MDC1535203.1 hypothetical protein [Gammaproteobacteria bacterium]
MNNNVREATPEEAIEWNNSDYFIGMKFDPLVMFVVIPALIQIIVLATMLGSMALTGLFFG